MTARKLIKKNSTNFGDILKFHTPEKVMIQTNYSPTRLKLLLQY